MSDPSNVDGARHGAAPRMTVFPSEVSVWLAEKASQLCWAFVSLSRHELHEWLASPDAAKLVLEEVHENE